MTNQRPSGNQPTRVKKKVDPIKKKHRKINNNLILLLCVISLVAIGAFGFNIYKVIASSKAGGTGSTLTTSGSSMKNDLYEIGNNPTKVQQKYFQELSDAVTSGDTAAIATQVVKSFVADYYTWTNKDGNYEVGGLQYIYGAKTSAFELFSRYNFYADLDLYISQYGRNNLLQVKNVEITEAAEAPDFFIAAMDPQVTLPCYYVKAIWTYESSSLDTSAFQQVGYFYVVNNEGRMEIVEFYDDGDSSTEETTPENPEETSSTEG